MMTNFFKITLVASVLVISVSALAQSRDRGDRRGDNLDNRGNRIVRVVVGRDDETPREMSRRIRLLEQAVRDLQTRVYELEEDERFSCTLSINPRVNFEGTGATQREAEMEARRECSRQIANPFACDRALLSCIKK